MRAARFHGPGDLRLEERPEPEPGEGQVRIRPRAVGLCGTDAHILRGEFSAARPVVLGHEIAGIVDAVGSGVVSVAEGDLVTVQPNLSCGSCHFCRLGREHLCLHRSAIGVDRDGALAEALVVPAPVAYRLPQGIDARIGCLAEPVACCIHGMDRLAPLPGLPLLVLGAGPAGLILLRLARLHGAAPIVAVEPNDARRAAARTFGADHVIDPGHDDWRQLALALSGGHGFDAVIEAVGAATVLETAIALAAPGGKVLVFGAAPAEALAQIRPHEFFARELTMIGTVINPRTQERAVEMLAALSLDAMTIATFPLEHVREAFDAQAAGAAAKVEVLPQGAAWDTTVSEEQSPQTAAGSNS